MRIKENLDLLIVALSTLAIIFYDVTLHFVLELMHTLFEIAHILFEWFELGIEHTVEHLFHTSRHGSQLVTFYILMTMLAGIMYLLWRLFPRILKSIRQRTLDAWVKRKTQITLYWHYQSLPRKLVLAATIMGVAYLASFFVM
ncbi:MAG: hypothetical protein KGZ80_08640 [Methylomonas sp.]|nr:hypothetical protein [Methylomonas sp.]PPD19989.1 MAG: hypothetical protein CTY23_10320 [Methylomonas sp.]PPD26509.1 MAG: hypothetical protein CTY22_04885 [Methylomonas sp.]PPD36953.1 MAG: hypothetical protein CTY17_11000 [Methylomonas sp.]PPD38276.1 MAG: hypothetical protein CTY21_04880 [Methylomonas sp.]